MKLQGKIVWWSDKGFGSVEVKHADFSVERYFLHSAAVIRCVPDAPAVGHRVVFEPDTARKLKKPTDLVPAINAEIYLAPVKDGGAR